MKHQSEQNGVLIIGFGNRQCRDDGIGPYIVERLAAILHVSETFRFLVVPRLTVDVLDEMRTAGMVVFIDATAESLEKGWRCAPLTTEAYLSDFHAHQLTPAFLLEVSRLLYQKNVPAWIVSVQGEDFGPGSGITPAARKRVEKAFSSIVETVIGIHEKKLN
jgi:hydrogenase maturation protease